MYRIKLLAILIRFHKEQGELINLPTRIPSTLEVCGGCGQEEGTRRTLEPNRPGGKKKHRTGAAQIWQLEPGVRGWNQRVAASRVMSNDSHMS